MFDVFTEEGLKAKKEQDDIWRELCDFQNENYHIFRKGQNLLTEIEQLKTRLAECEAEYKNIEQDYEAYVQRENELKALDKEAEEKYRQAIQNDWSKFIYTLNDDNSMRIWLRRDTNTVPIMDEFYHSKLDFLVFFHFAYIGWSQYCSLVVTRASFNIEKATSLAPTLTELKQRKGYYHASAKLKPLLNEISKLTKDKELNQGDILAFSKPFPIRGQIWSDREDFNWEKEYGQTTLFYAIGIKVDNSRIQRP